MYEEFHFPGQLENENIILFLRRHWFIFLKRLLLIIAAIIALLFVYFTFSALNNNFTESEYHNLLLFGESLATLFIWNFFFILWLDFYLDVWIVTNERIINIEQRGFFNRDISELKLTKVQDVTSEIIRSHPLFSITGISTSRQPARKNVLLSIKFPIPIM